MEKCKKCGRYKATRYSECECEKTDYSSSNSDNPIIPDLTDWSSNSSSIDNSSSSDVDFGGGDFGGGGSGGDW